MGGVIVHQSEIKEYWKMMDDVGIQISENFFMVPTSRRELEKKGVFNHSCEPNLGFSNSITLVAIRNIKKREELVFDYAFSETFRNVMKCQCGSDSCRKEIRSDDWKIEKIRKKYGQYFSPYLRNR